MPGPEDLQDSGKDVTQLLTAWRSGDRAALDQLMAIVYDELRSLANRFLRDERDGHTLQTTALVHEAYLKLAGYSGVEWQNRAHFFAIAASVIRHILVDHARSRQRDKRGGGALRLSLDEAGAAPQERDPDLVALDDSLLSLTRIDPRQSRIVELRYFGGLSVEETAEVMGISTATVKRDWTVARAFLYHDLSQRGAFAAS